jgi:hypothetical protein
MGDVSSSRWPPRHTGETCVLCRRQHATRKGEHVWPQWYLRDQDKTGPGPFAWTHNGEPIRDRRGTPIAAGAVRMRTMLPVCGSCNGLLEQRFESPTKAVLRKMFAAEGNVSLTVDDAGRIGQWFAKTLLLQVHPRIHYAHPAVDEQAVRLAADEVPPGQYYEWLISSAPPPAGLSVWVHRADPGQRGRPLHRVPLPRVTADGATVDFVEFAVTLHGVCATVVVHPGWRIEHPLEAAGQAVRLLPAPVADVDLALLPVLGHNAVSWTRCNIELKSGVLNSSALPPLRASRDIFGFLPEVWPLATHWGG